ncbi:MAG: DUF418 domain-containing protein [Sphingomonadaceae bacterium]
MEFSDGLGENDGTPDQPRAQPLGDSRSRIASLDVTRGVAVLGILIANIIAFGQPFDAYSYPGAFLAPVGPVDHWLWAAQLVLVDGKFRGVFTLLFGAGIYLFMERAWARGEGFERQIRRLAWLGVFGLAHFILLWRGDILFSYAVAGFGALFFLDLSPGRQVLLGVLAYVAGAVLSFTSTVPMEQAADGHFAAQTEMAATQSKLLEAEADDLSDGSDEAAILTRGDYPTFIAHTVAHHLPSLPFQTLYFAFETLPLMLIGTGLYRLGLFSGGFAAREQLLWGGAAAALSVATTIPIALWALGKGLSFYATIAAFDGWSAIPRLAGSLGYLALLALYGRCAHGWIAHRFALAGRTAFSNYLGTSAAMMLVFPGWGFGLFGELTRLQLYGVVLVAWVVMLAWPGPWLARFRYGPLEWLWRCLTYGRMVPMRRR